MDPFIAQIMMFAGNFAPRGWAFCNGQILSIAQNTALFSLIGTTYGGNGQTTFGLPDLRSRFAMHAGQGPGLTFRSLGQTGGTETNTLSLTQMPTHNHGATLHAETAAGTTASPTNRMLAIPTGGNLIYTDSVPASNIAMHPDSIVVGSTGAGQPVNNMPPFQTVNYIIALVGIFPSRS